MQIETREIKIPLGALVGPEQRPIYGYATPKAFCAGGLAVHKDTAGLAVWHVTHEASGFRIGPLSAKTKRQALANMQAALALPFDWSRPETDVLADLRNNRGIVDAVRAISA